MRHFNVGRMHIINILEFLVLVCSDVFHRREKMIIKNPKISPFKLSRLHSWRLERHLKREGRFISAIRVKSNANDEGIRRKEECVWRFL